MLIFLPAGPEAEGETTVGDMIERGRDLGQHRRVTVGVARHHGAQANGGHRRRHPRQHGESLVHRAVSWLRGIRHEVVGVPKTRIPESSGRLSCGPGVVP